MCIKKIKSVDWKSAATVVSISIGLFIGMNRLYDIVVAPEFFEKIDDFILILLGIVIAIVIRRLFILSKKMNIILAKFSVIDKTIDEIKRRQ